MPQFDLAVDLIEAVALGRSGRRDEADARVAGVPTSVADLVGTGIVHVLRMLIGSTAARDGWGEPAAWMREAEAFFAAGGYERAARRCRLTLAEVRAPVPRRGRGDSVVPPSLRALGVTSREVDVLKLVAAGFSTREVSERLVLSTKTIDRHLSSLFDRTGVRRRAALVELARHHGLVDG